MAVKFPQQIDSFSIKSPNEIVQSAHVNDLQDVIVAIEVFTKSLEQSLGSHLEAGSAHSSLEISVEAITGLDTTNLQTALESLKSSLETMIGDLETDTETNLEAHRQLDIDLAHPNGTFPGSRITDNSIAGSKIQAGAISIDKIGFDLATQIELDAHSSTNIATAHPNGTFPIARLDTPVATQASLDAHSSTNIATAHPNGTFPIARLDTPVATQASFDLHTNASSDVHGIGAGSQVVGTKTTQTLEGKKIISRYEGTKALFFKEQVLDVETELYNSSSFSAAQFEIRDRAVWEVVGVDHSGPKSIITLSGSNKFDDVIGQANQVDFFQTASGIKIDATVESSPTSNQIILTTLEPQVVIGWFVRNKKKAIPTLSVVDSTIRIKELEVESGLSNITIQEDLDITGDLSVLGQGTIEGNLVVEGNLTSLGNFSALGISSNSAQVSISSPQLSAKAITLENSLSVGTNLAVNGNQTNAGNLDLNGNQRIDGYLSVGNYTSIEESLFVGGSINSVGGIQARELDIATDARLGGGLHAEGYSSIDNSLFVNGDVTITGQINVTGLGTVVGPAASTNHALARYDGYSGIFILDSLAILDDNGLLFTPNLDSYGISLDTIDGYDSLVINKSGLGYALKIENLVDAYTSPVVVDSYGFVGIGTLTPTRKLEIIGDSYFSNQLKPVKGSTLAPIYSFDGDEDSGVWSSAANNLDFAVAGVNQLNINGSSVVVVGDLEVNGGDLSTSGTSFNLLNSVNTLTIGTSTATTTYDIAVGATSSGNTKTINLGTNGVSGSTTNINIGSTNSGTVTVNNNLTVSGNLTVNGTTTQLNVTNLEVEDQNIRINKNGTDGSANGAGLSIEGTGPSTLANLLYDSTLASRFKVGLDGYESEVLTSSTTQVITGSKTFSSAVSISQTSNQIVLGTTNTTTIDALTPANSRTYSIPDAGSDAYFVMTEGNQTIAGSKTLDLLITKSESVSIDSSTIAISKGLAVIDGADGYTLNTVSGMIDGQQVVLINNTGSLITITNADNIRTGTGRDFRFAHTSAAILAFSTTTGKAQLLGGGNGTDAWEIKTSSGNVVVGVKYFVDTSGGSITLTFPLSPQLGDTITICDPNGSWSSTNSVTLSGNGKTIKGSSTLILNTNVQSKAYTFVFYSTANNWVLTQGPANYGG